MTVRIVPASFRLRHGHPLEQTSPLPAQAGAPRHNAAVAVDRPAIERGLAFHPLDRARYAHAILRPCRRCLDHPRKTANCGHPSYHLVHVDLLNLRRQPHAGMLKRKPKPAGLRTVPAVVLMGELASAPNESSVLVKEHAYEKETPMFAVGHPGRDGGY